MQRIKICINKSSVKIKDVKLYKKITETSSILNAEL